MNVSVPAGTYPHGTNAKARLERCRCEECRAASAAYERRRTRDRAYGRGGNVDAEPARRHVLGLMAKGMGYKRIAIAAGLNPKTVYVLVAGRAERGTPPPRSIRRSTADALLAVPLRYSRRQPVDALIVWEMVADLMGLGYGKAAIARMLGYKAPALQVGSAPTVRAETYVAIKQLWEKTTTPRPEATHRDRIAAVRARNYAKKLRKRIATRKARRAA